MVATAALPFNGNMHFQVDQDRAVSEPASGLLTPARDADDPSATSDNGPDPSDTDGDGPTKPGDLTIDPDLIEAPRNGTVTVNGDGSFTYTPYSGFTGRDWFTYRTDDGTAQGDYASAFIDVQPVPQAAVTLTVGNFSDPALPGLKQDTPFVPVDDGYFSDTQPAPNDKLDAPDPADPELVPASVNTSKRGRRPMGFNIVRGPAPPARN